MANQWWCKISGVQAGPVSLQDLKKLAAAGKLTPDDLVRDGPTGQWVPASRLSELWDEGSARPNDSDSSRSQGETMSRWEFGFAARYGSCLASLLILYGLLSAAVPSAERGFEEADVPVPRITVLAMNLSHLIRDHWLPSLLLLVALAVVLLMMPKDRAFPSLCAWLLAVSGILNLYILAALALLFSHLLTEAL